MNSQEERTVFLMALGSELWSSIFMAERWDAGVQGFLSYGDKESFLYRWLDTLVDGKNEVKREKFIDDFYGGKEGYQEMKELLAEEFLSDAV